MSESHIGQRPGLFGWLVGPLSRKNALSWGLLIVAVFVIRWGLFETYSIPTGSMEPTLHGDPRAWRGDRVGVNKLVYGPRVPFTNHRLFRLGEPQRWDIVVFNTPQENAVHKRLIKRVVGLPGERIYIKDGQIWVNGQPMEPPDELRYILNYTTELAYDEDDVRAFSLHMAKSGLRSPLLNATNSGVKDLYAELDALAPRLADKDLMALPEAESVALFNEITEPSRKTLAELFRMNHALQYPLRYGVLEDDEYSVVPEDCYLVCGDNSGESADGRYFGWLPNGNIFGRAFCIWWPLERMRDLTGFSKTWWGMALLYVFPAGLVGYEVTRAWRKRK